MYNITKEQLAKLMTDNDKISVDVYKGEELSIQYCEDAESVEESVDLVFNNPDHDKVVIMEWVKLGDPHKPATEYALAR